jgi:membrane associated rhomboid family serine protease
VFVVASMFPDARLINWLAFDFEMLMAGQVWRLFTFVFIPPTPNIFFMLIACYFYYWIGKTLENEWGKLKFNIFYLAGMLATILFCVLTRTEGTALYLNMSLFFAYATLYPEQRILLFLIIPVKIKYVAFIMAAIFFVIPMFDFREFPMNLLPLVAMLNYFLFFWDKIRKLAKNQTIYGKKRVDFKSAVQQSRSRPDYEGHVHKCAECGLTDTKDPNMEFRYCSMCAHYECYCSQHIFTHEHVK